MALTRDDSRSWIADSTRGGSFPVLEIWNPGSRIPSAPDAIRDVGFTVQVEIPHKDSMLESENAIQDALNQSGVTATAKALEHFERPSCLSRPDGVPGGAAEQQDQGGAHRNRRHLVERKRKPKE